MVSLTRIYMHTSSHRSVFEIIGKSHYQDQKRMHRLRCAILWQNVTWFLLYFWISENAWKIFKMQPFKTCFAFQMSMLERLENVLRLILMRKFAMYLKRGESVEAKMGVRHPLALPISSSLNNHTFWSNVKHMVYFLDIETKDLKKIILTESQELGTLSRYHKGNRTIANLRYG